MKKLTSTLFILIISLFCITSLCAFSSKENNKNIENDIKKETIQNSNQKQEDIWCITFQLVWNEFLDKMLKGQPAKFVGGNPQIADELNKKLYTKKDISENSYYISTGKISKSRKKEIENSIYKKFKEKSDILDMINWNVKDGYLFYAMLKKIFTFENPFDILAAEPFNNSNETVKFFGIEKNSNKKLLKNVNILFYNSDDEYAIRLYSKEKEDVILYRTSKEDSFENTYNYIKQNSKNENFTKYDLLKIPEIEVDKTISYDDICGKEIENTKYIITQAFQTIKFKLDNKGGRLKSEAAMTLMRMSLEPENKVRNFSFDKPFILFLVEHEKDKPYYAMKIENTDYLVKSK